jgi:hypothetical protein
MLRKRGKNPVYPHASQQLPSRVPKLDLYFLVRRADPTY